ncbi:hypothetical protein R5R35_006490 [Gryllus longicercus]|uniref:CH-like domain-containing protein n=1 Tax=Gryllus longicercus TaxID=2509291 RepID=A0AAN9V5F5_9ORTH
MSEVIKRWVACKTGVEPDLEPRALRRLLADGTLLARLLHSYFVVDAALREQVRATDDPELRRKNWAVLRRWLLLVGLELADDVIKCVIKSLTNRLLFKSAQDAT